MRATIISAVALTVALASGATAGPEAPKIRQGMPYEAARATILSAGWQASIFKKTILNKLSRDLQAWFISAGFMEVEECAPTGDAFCTAEFHDAEGKRTLYVFTTSGSREEIQYIGHNPQVVSFCINRKTVNCEEPIDANGGAALSGTNSVVSNHPASWQGCTREQAAQIIQTQRTLQASNDPCVVHWRSVEVRQHPERAADLECAGLKAFEDPQPQGHPIPLAECDRITREGQKRFGLPAMGLGEDQKAMYRATWGK